jgi:hypothetical protein
MPASYEGTSRTPQTYEDSAPPVLGVNPFELIVGNSNTPDGRSHSVLWRDGQITELLELLSRDKGGAKRPFLTCR